MRRPTPLRTRLLRLAYQKPHLRKEILSLVTRTASSRSAAVFEQPDYFFSIEVEEPLPLKGTRTKGPAKAERYIKETGEDETVHGIIEVFVSPSELSHIKRTVQKNGLFEKRGKRKYSTTYGWDDVSLAVWPLLLDIEIDAEGQTGETETEAEVFFYSPRGKELFVQTFPPVVDIKLSFKQVP